MRVNKELLSKCNGMEHGSVCDGNWYGPTIELYKDGKRVNVIRYYHYQKDEYEQDVKFIREYFKASFKD